MPGYRIRFGEHECESGGERETVLDALLRAGASVSHACKAGACGSCLLKAVAGPVPAAAQQGLKDSWKAQGYLLACQCVPEGDLELEPPGAEARLGAIIAGIHPLSQDVLRVRIAPEGNFDYRPGQFVTIRRRDGLARSYSLASLREAEHLELHVRILPQGRMSGWLASEARAGDPLDLIGPAGECFYVPGSPEQPLLLAGTGTGLAPLYGILREALAQGHRGPIRLFHGALQPEGLYLREELEALAHEHDHVQYTPAVLRGEGPGIVTGALDRVILAEKPAGWTATRAFLCGDPAIVNLLRKQLFLAGLGFNQILADAFLPSAS